MPFRELKTYGIICDRCNISELKIDSWQDPMLYDKYHIDAILHRNVIFQVGFPWSKICVKLDQASWKYEGFVRYDSSNRWALKNFICPQCIMKEVLE